MWERVADRRPGASFTLGGFSARIREGWRRLGAISYAAWCWMLLAVAGLFAFVIHGYFLLAGRPEFRLPLSLLLLVLILPVSIWQLGLTLQKLRTTGHK